MTKRVEWHYGPCFSGTHPVTCLKMFYAWLRREGITWADYLTGKHRCPFAPDEYTPNWYEAMQMAKRRFES